MLIRNNELDIFKYNLFKLFGEFQLLKLIIYFSVRNLSKLITSYFTVFFMLYLVTKKSSVSIFEPPAARFDLKFGQYHPTHIIYNPRHRFSTFWFFDISCLFEGQNFALFWSRLNLIHNLEGYLQIFIIIFFWLLKLKDYRYFKDILT